MYCLNEFKRIIDSGGFQIEIKGATHYFHLKLSPKKLVPYPCLQGVVMRGPGDEQSRVGQTDDYDTFWRRLQAPIGAVHECKSKAEINQLLLLQILTRAWMNCKNSARRL